MIRERIIIALISLVFTAVIYLLLPIEFSKYQLQLADSREFIRIFDQIYEDLDGDGEKEFIRAKFGDPLPAIVVHRADQTIIGQWNLKGEWIKASSLQTTDLDNNGYREIVSFTYFEDSVWINLVEPLLIGGMDIRIPVDRVQLVAGEQDWRVREGVAYDLNGDGLQEYIFTVSASFSKLPRRLFALDVGSLELKGSDPLIGSGISDPMVVDLDLDGEPEIALNSSAPGNIKDAGLSYTDSCSWLFLFNPDLEFRLHPVPYPGSPSYLRVSSLHEEGKEMLVCFYFNTFFGVHPKILEVFSLDKDSLIRIARKTIINEEPVTYFNSRRNQSSFDMLFGSDCLISFDSELKEVTRRDLDLISGRARQQIVTDIDGDGNQENVLYTDSRWLTVLDKNLRHPVHFDLGREEEKPSISSFIQDGIPHLVVFRKPLRQSLSYVLNPFYPFRYALIVFLMTLHYLLFSVIFRWQRRSIERKQHMEKEVLAYQLKNVKQQLEPHFLFNAMTGISSYYRKGDNSLAQSYLSKVSRLMLYSLENTEKSSVSLLEELQFVKNYLTVESLSLGERFDFEFMVEEDSVKGLKVPKMLVQNFVENALKHGIRHLTDRKGMLRIITKREDGYLFLVVEDNGVGRAKAQEIGSKGTGQGIKMINRILDIFHKLEKVRISYEIVDLTDNSGKAAGTSVHLRFPVIV